MEKELRKSIDKLRSLSPQLNAAAEQASRVVLFVEKFLNEECKAGLPHTVTVWTKTPEHDQYADSDDYEGLYLGYDRVGGKFRITVQKNSKEWDDINEKVFVQTSVVPWSDSARAEKLQTFPHIPDLLHGLANGMENAIKVTGETALTIDQIMEAMQSTDHQPKAVPRARERMAEDHQRTMIEEDID